MDMEVRRDSPERRRVKTIGMRGRSLDTCGIRATWRVDAPWCPELEDGIGMRMERRGATAIVCHDFMQAI